MASQGSSRSSSHVDRRAYGEFDTEVYCLCGFVADRYVTDKGYTEFEDPDASQVIVYCPQCDRGTELFREPRRRETST